jgi:phosphoadenosine phosphosulfate reductase
MLCHFILIILVPQLPNRTLLSKYRIYKTGFIMEQLDVKKINEQMANMDPFERVEWALETFGSKLCFTSSFGIQSAIMAHIASKVDKSIPILFLDTGYHFAETLAYKEYLEKRFELNVVPVKPKLLRMEFEQKHGYAYDFNQDFCCMQHKTLPLKAALQDYDCWATGIRSTQAETRKDTPFLIQHKDKRKTFKLSPIADYTDKEVELHFKLYDLPQHPLKDKGYMSVGCLPCTAKTLPGDQARSGRWRGRSKVECGIHLMHGEGEGI